MIEVTREIAVCCGDGRTLRNQLVGVGTAVLVFSFFAHFKYSIEIIINRQCRKYHLHPLLRFKHIKIRIKENYDE